MESSPGPDWPSASRMSRDSAPECVCRLAWRPPGRERPPARGRGASEDGEIAGVRRDARGRRYAASRACLSKSVSRSHARIEFVPAPRSATSSATSRALLMAASIPPRTRRRHRSEDMRTRRRKRYPSAIARKPASVEAPTPTLATPPRKNPLDRPAGAGVASWLRWIASHGRPGPVPQKP